MYKDSDLPEIVFATHNPNKSLEVAAMLSGIYKVKNLNDINIVDEIPETGSTIEENSRIKVRYLHEKAGINCFADDSGLEVEALNGEPGVHSARYSGEPKDDVRNVDLLLKNLAGISNRKGQFRTVVTLILDGIEKQFEGIVTGTIIDEKRGSAGFGYDPIFIPDGYNLTFAEMSTEEKNTISHRGKAVRALVEYLKNSFSPDE